MIHPGDDLNVSREDQAIDGGWLWENIRHSKEIAERHKRYSVKEQDTEALPGGGDWNREMSEFSMLYCSIALPCKCMLAGHLPGPAGRTIVEPCRCLVRGAPVLPRLGLENVGLARRIHSG